MKEGSECEGRVDASSGHNDRCSSIQGLRNSASPDVRVDAQELGRSAGALDSLTASVTKRREWRDRSVPIPKARVRGLNIVAPDGRDQHGKAFLRSEHLDRMFQTDWVQTSSVTDEFYVVLDELW